jgi:hypothetical protein
MTIDEVQKEYVILRKSEDPFETIFDFKESLLSSDEVPFLNLHYSILTDRDNDSLYLAVRSFFDDRKDKKKVGEFLFSKYKAGIDDVLLKADVIQILGHLRSQYAKEVALENIQANKGDLRYRSIIVLGWVASEKELDKLNDRILHDKDPQLRGYAATAMRQIWFNYPKSKDTILKYLKQAIEQEKDEKALEGIIIASQELLKKKLGLKESKYGDVSGDIIVAKAKTVAALEKY